MKHIAVILSLLLLGCDSEKSRLEELASRGDPKAQLEYAIFLERRVVYASEKRKEILKKEINYWLEKSAEQGEANAYYWLANYANKKDRFTLYKKAAELGHNESKYWLAEYYAEGEFVKLDLHKAEELYLQSMGNEENIATLAKIAAMYATAKGDLKNDEKAFFYYKKIAAYHINDLQHDSEKHYGEVAVRKIHDHYFKGSMEQKLNWLEDVANHGSRTATDLLINYFYKSGDFTNTLKWSEKIEDYNYIVRMYLYGIGVEKNPDKAYTYFNKSKYQDKKLLAYMYIHGLGVEQDREKAFIMYGGKNPKCLFNSSITSEEHSYYSCDFANLGLMKENYQIPDKYQHYFHNGIMGISAKMLYEEKPDSPISLIKLGKRSGLEYIDYEKLLKATELIDELTPDLIYELAVALCDKYDPLKEDLDSDRNYTYKLVYPLKIEARKNKTYCSYPDKVEELLKLPELGNHSDALNMLGELYLYQYKEKNAALGLFKNACYLDNSMGCWHYTYNLPREQALDFYGTLCDQGKTHACQEYKKLKEN